MSEHPVEGSRGKQRQHEVPRDAVAGGAGEHRGHDRLVPEEEQRQDEEAARH